ncbi:MAG: hypothetical protein J6579_10780, partial [Snodgrassella sp.]|nr:hypothetical protein [Snodgrassella sp.]
MDAKTNSQTTLQSDKLSLTSKGNTILIGAQAIANSVRTLSADMARKANQELQTNNPELWQDYNQLSEDKKQLVLRETSKDYR